MNDATFDENEIFEQCEFTQSNCSFNENDQNFK